MSRVETVIVSDVFAWCIDSLDIPPPQKKLILYIFNLLPREDPDFNEVQHAYMCLLSDLPWNCTDKDLRSREAELRRSENLRLFRLSSRDYLPGIIGFLMYYLDIHKVKSKTMLSFADCIYLSTYAIPLSKLAETFREAKKLMHIKRLIERSRIVK